MCPHRCMCRCVCSCRRGQVCLFVQMWACMCICVSLKVHISICVYPYRYVCICRYEQVWDHVCVPEGMRRCVCVQVHVHGFLCRLVSPQVWQVYGRVCVPCSWVDLHPRDLQQRAPLYSPRSEGQEWENQRGAEKSKQRKV